MEATGMSWFVVGQYLERAGVAVYRVNGQQASELRRIYKPRAKSNRIEYLYNTPACSMYSRDWWRK
jgi:hypothetical protein